MRTLPLFYYPGTWVYVDDDKTLLGCMSLAFETSGNYKTFSSPHDCLSFLNAYQSPSSLQNFLSSQKSDESYGILQHTPVDFDITKLAQLAHDQNRHHEITAMVIDYHMPEMNGFALSQACDRLPISKILLTGTTEDEKVISGFNHNYIQHYIQKGAENFEKKVITQLKALSFAYFQKITSPLLAHLEAENVLPLSDPIFVDFFLDYCARKNIHEYYLMDKQGSFLCIDNNGKHFYFVVHTDRSMDTWLETYFTGTEFPADFVECIEDRHAIPFFGMGIEAWELETTQWHTYFHTPQKFSGREDYYWFEMEA